MLAREGGNHAQTATTKLSDAELQEALKEPPRLEGKLHREYVFDLWTQTHDAFSNLDVDLGLMVLRRDLNYKLCQIEQVRLIGQMLGQDLDGGDTVQLSVAGLVHFAHRACANQRGDLVGPESCARLDRKSSP